MEDALLPKEIIKQIAAFVDTKDTPAFAATCKQCAAFVKEMYKLTEEYYAVKYYPDEEQMDQYYDNVNLQVKIVYMKNIAIENNEGRNVKIKRMPYCNKMYISVCRLNIISFTITDLGSRFRSVNQINIYVPRYCKSFIADKSMYNYTVNLKSKIGGSKIESVESHWNTDFGKNVHVSKNLNIVSAEHIQKTIGQIFQIAADCESITIPNSEKELRGVEVISNSNVRTLKAAFICGDLKFFLRCPNLRVLDLTVKFRKKDINIDFIDIFLKDSAIHMLEDAARKLREMFEVCGDLRVINIEHNVSFDVAGLLTEGIADYLEECGFRPVYDEFRYDDVKKYGRIAVDIVPDRSIAAICGYIYIHKSAACKYILDRISFIIQLLNLSRLFYNEEEGDNVVLEYEDEKYEVEEKDLAAFGIDQIAAYFRYDGLHNKYSLREYFPFV